MTTATRKKTDPLTELEAREQAHAEAKATASDLGSEWGTRSRQLQALHDERRRLVFHDPTLVDHTGAAVGDNRIAEIDAEIAKLGDLGELESRLAHARQIADSAKQAVDGYAAAHLDELLAALEPEAEAAVANMAAAMAALGDAASEYLNMAQRVNALKGTNPGRRHLRVPAIDTASDLVRMAEHFGTPPLPTEVR
jgi:hypothetical protein